MAKASRKTGLEALGDVSWGTHICLFYESTEDLLQVLAPYFKAGLENNEHCLWVVPEDLSKAKARTAIKKVVRNIESYVKKGQFDILTHSEWYLSDGAFDPEKVFRRGTEKVARALSKGLDGVRAGGCCGGLRQADWEGLTRYEGVINNAIGGLQAIAICCYPLPKYGPHEVVDIIRHHPFALVKREGKWDLVESGERRRAVEAIQEGERFLSDLFASIQDGISILDHTLTIVRANPTVERWQSHALPLAGKKCYEAYHSRKEPCDPCPSRRALETGKAHYDVVRKSGVGGQPVGWLEIYSFPHLDAATGEMKGVIEYVRDITERRWAEEASKENERKLRELFDNAPVGYHELDVDGRIRQVNRTELTMLGYAAEEMIGHCVWEFVEEAEASRQAFLAKIAGLTPPGRQFERTYRRKDGALTPVLIEDRILQDSRGKIVGIRSTIQSISERKRAEEVLRESEEKYRTLVHQLPDGICIHQDGRIVFSNETHWRMLGFQSEKEILGKDAFEFVAPESRDLVRERVNKRLRGAPAPPRYDIKSRRRDGSTFDSVVIAGPTVFNGRPAIQVVLRDITDRKRAEEKIVRQSAVLRGINRALEETLRCETDEEVARTCLAVAQELTGSKFGWIGEVNQAGRLDTLALSNPGWDACKMPASEAAAMIRNMEIRGVWGSVIRDGASLIANDPSTHPHRVGLPSGHPPLTSFMGVPLKQGGKTIGMIALGNKQPGYALSDQEAVEALSVPLVEALRRKRSDERILLLNRLLRTIAEINQLMVREQDRGRLLAETCRILVELGGFSMAWIGMADFVKGEVHPIAQVGFKGDYLGTANIRCDDTPHGRGPTGTAIRTEKHVVCNDVESDDRMAPWRRQAKDQGYRSSAAFPLRLHDRVMGAINVYSTETDAFREEMVVLLDELAGDIGFALQALDERAHRKLAEDRLRLTQFSVDYASDAVFWVGPDSRIVYVNDSACRSLGYSRQELLTMRVTDIDPDFPPEAWAKYWEGHRQRRHLSIESRHRRKDGSTFPVEVSSNYLESAGKEYCFAFARDITERKRAGEQIARLNALKEHLLGTRRLHEKLKLVTDGVVEIFGADFARVWTTKEADLCDRGCIHARVTEGPDVCRDRTRCLHLAASSGRYSGTDGSHRRVPLGCYKIGRVASGEDSIFVTNDVGNDPRVHDRDWARTLGLVSFAGFQLLSAEGKPIGVLALFSKRAITPNEQALMQNLANTVSQVILAGLGEEALRERNETLRALIQASPVAIVSLDPAGNITSWSAAAERMFGWSTAEVMGRPSPIVPPEKQEEVRAYRERLLRGEIITDMEIRRVRKDGSPVDLRLSTASLRDSDGRVTGSIALLSDITEHKRLEEELLKAKKVESLGILAGGVAHDFNNLLSVVLGNISLARTKMGSEDKAKIIERLLEAERACLRSRDLTRQLLTFSKGGAPLRKTVSVAELLKESAGFALRGSRSRCEFSVPDDLWPADVDAGQISQVIQNLIINADQATPDGGTIRVGAENVPQGAQSPPSLPEGRYIRVTIEDRGIGIPKEHLHKVFDPYFTTKQKGSGLGLSIAYSIIQRHDGHLALESELGAGTRVTFHLPASSKAVPTEPGPGGPLPRGKGKILVMDDEEMIRDLIAAMLAQLGYESACAADGVKALDLYRKAKYAGDPFDAVIMDLTVPGGMGGRQAIGKLLEFDPEARAIVSSGYSDDPIMSDFRQYGFVGVIAKPYKIEDMGAVLHKVVARPPRESSS